MEQMRQFAFTGHYPVFRDRIVSPIYVSSPEEGCPIGVKAKAAWDTGSSATLVSRRVADLLSLPYDGRAVELRSGLGGKGYGSAATARMKIMLGSASITMQVLVLDKPYSDMDCDVLLGLDFMMQGDLSITHDGEQLVLSFTYPPIGIPVDYTEFVPRMVPGTAVERVADLDSDGNERFRRNLILDDYFSGEMKQSD